MAATAPYTEQFFEAFHETSRASARVVVAEILKFLSPTSVVDIGCGEGVWLSVFAEHGVSRIFGVDGDHVKRDRLVIPQSQFAVRDLSRPFSLPERFSLVVSLEVAEHLPVTSAEGFVGALTALGEVVLFSAAVPYQTGVQHVNLQWQDYWARLFAARGYLAVDAIRPVIWQNESVSFWYRQNMLLFVDENHLRSQPALTRAWEETRHTQLSVAHPRFVTLLQRAISAEQLETLSLRQVLPRLPRMLMGAVGRTIGLSGRNRTGEPGT